MKKYIETLDGIVPFAASRVMLMCFDSHAIPVDDRLRRCLVEADVIGDELELPQLATWLAKQVKANAARQTHFDLQKW